MKSLKLISWRMSASYKYTMTSEKPNNHGNYSETGRYEMKHHRNKPAFGAACMAGSITAAEFTT
jgi:hypothetical protein